jgi:hypothetical protein
LEKEWQDGSNLTGLWIALHPQDKRDKSLKRLEKLKEKNFAGKGDLQDFLLAKNGSMKMD